MNQPRYELFDSLSELLIYPETGLADSVSRCVSLATENRSPALASLEKFADHVAQSDVDSLQELYTRTFEINPVTALEVGWHLYGERYERGEFLTRMRSLLRDLDLKESTELPDHLTQALKALGRLDDEHAPAFAQKFLVPAIEKMMAGFDGKNSPYENVIKSIHRELTSTYSLLS